MKTSENNKTRVASQMWNLNNSNALSDLDEYLQSDIRIKLDCDGCQPRSPRCRCKVARIPRELKYDVSIVIEETLRSETTHNATISRRTYCPIIHAESDMFYCEWPDNSTVILASQVCDGTEDCEGGRDEEVCQPSGSNRVIFIIVGGAVVAAIFLVAGVLVAVRACARTRTSRHRSF